MQKKFRISVDGRSYNVVVEELLSEVGNGFPAPAEAAIAAAPSVVAVAAPVAAIAAPAVVALASAPGDEVAPLAGVVDSVEVHVGQAVALGDKIATIEAMKMKTEVFAKHSGTVTRIAVKAFDSVDTGQILLTVG
jgi:biotin carboxyl carrier protein